MVSEEGVQDQHLTVSVTFVHLEKIPLANVGIGDLIKNVGSVTEGYEKFTLNLCPKTGILSSL